MTLNLLIAPDFSPERFAGWHMLNTLLQKKSGLHLHLLTPASAAEQADLIAKGDVDMVYANPFDAASMVRDSGYQAVARPVGKSDEMVIATGADSALNVVEDLKPGCKIALTDNKDVKLIGLRLLEPADLTEADVQWQLVENYQAAARLAIKGEVDASFFLAEAYHSLSRLTKTQLKPLIESKLTDIVHVFLMSAKAIEHEKLIQDALTGLTGTPDGQPVLDELGISGGFESMTAEDAEFMIDLMETLLD
ncbi:phosphate/phosphite/phosphonate ABC transporter substrate-binding protein [Allofranklinella schreckenbergeri]|uniref:Phosphate/phosphite/phosphonate ABC transporter substrate-binding protein n=1 Tax=Allofranklinella schreckenbergeri TaxID=1076744 RepID=A0A3M6R6A6_9BURK|nr:phosphate/phosphite/phosphonate ABC transporter substrate-binding protein [Allofranklinella schreckenbergeri]MDO4704700.1 phosphate/phosphite/phosphonate ABC transporter substrate-binding protein [Comamonadaceae bacterium]RRD42004.1 phosphate/phosphite/phosphonate ABC transporter substrate-binding protein [Comamonadaceae bacterium OH3737_COT-264]RMX01410.1 phosphate/phosphite/phosphonate ABC transporter substrate-binding protein [Allofranklinella schreckenbergeri]RMX01698.1 phosphate/phosphi